MALQGEQLKRTKYTSLISTLHFLPFTIETLGALGQAALDFTMELGSVFTRLQGNLAAESTSCNSCPSLSEREHSSSVGVHRDQPQPSDPMWD